jgi:hypothetical protein
MDSVHSIAATPGDIKICKVNSEEQETL